MDSKRKSKKLNDINLKKRRNVFSLKIKLQIIQLHDNGNKAVNIARTLHLPPTTVRTIIKNREKTLASAGVCSLETTTVRRPMVLEKMEKELRAWISDSTGKDIVITNSIIQQKAISIFNELKANGDASDANVQFTASLGWIGRFKKRANMIFFKPADDSLHGIDKDPLSEIYQKTIEGEEYTLRQVSPANSSEAPENFPFMEVKQEIDESSEYLLPQLNLNKPAEDSIDVVNEIQQETDDEDGDTFQVFPLRKLTEAFDYITKALDIFEKYDNDLERVELTRQKIHKSLRCYKELYKSESQLY